MMEELLRELVDELTRVHGCHTVILYGSYARGDHSADSDVDVLGLYEGDRAYRDARPWNGLYLDAFVAPDAILETCDEELAKLSGGRILVQRADMGTRLLERVEAMLAQALPPPDPSEVQLRLSWARKMLGRLRRRDLEGNYRRHWLLYQLLEDYFYLRGVRFEGSKRGFRWLQAEDPEAYGRFEAALDPGASDDALERLVEHLEDMPKALADEASRP